MRFHREWKPTVLAPSARMSPEKPVVPRVSPFKSHPGDPLDAIDTSMASGRFFFHVMANLAEMERELTIERTRAGLEVARQLGRKGGRKRQMTESKIKSAKKLLPRAT